MWQRCVASVILFRLKAAGRQLASVPIGSSRKFDRLCFGLHIRNSAPFNVRLMRSTMDNAITTSPKGINKSRAATSQCAMNVSTASSREQINIASSRACRRSSTG
jgi:hypothetical protein